MSGLLHVGDVDFSELHTTFIFRVEVLQILKELYRSRTSLLFLVRFMSETLICSDYIDKTAYTSPEYKVFLQ
jgi:hypothetical protein